MKAPAFKTVRIDHGGPHIIISKGRVARPPEQCLACGAPLSYTVVILPDHDLEFSAQCLSCDRLITLQPHSYHASVSLPRGSA